MTSREQIIKSLSDSLKVDPKSMKWEYFTIISAFQNCNPCYPKELLESINSKYVCDDQPLFNYNSLYNNLRALNDLKVVQYNALKKEYSLSPEYFQVRYEYLPTSNYTILFFVISAGSWAVSILNYPQHIQTTTLIVLIGLFYLLGQHLGTEFKWKR